jgi:hypothetical protein
MSFKLFDWQCITCQHTFEELVSCSEGIQQEPNPGCPNCSNAETNAPSMTERCLHSLGTGHAAQDDHAKQQEIMSKTKHIQLRQQGRLPWRKSSYSQSGNE